VTEITVPINAINCIPLCSSSPLEAGTSSDSQETAQIVFPTACHLAPILSQINPAHTILF